MSLIDKDHPIWKIIQSLVGLAALFIYLDHVTSDPKVHSDIPDVIGVLGSGIMAKLGWQYFRSDPTKRKSKRS